MQNRIEQKKHILLVDDEVDATQMLCMLLETRGYDVQVAHTGKEAMGQTLTQRYTLYSVFILQWET